MKKKLRDAADRSDDVVFRPAITPLEAAVLPALEKKTYGTLGMVRCVCSAGGETRAQRAKIWVR